MPDVTLGGAFLVGRAGIFLRAVQHSECFASPNRRSRVPVKQGVEVQPLTYVSMTGLLNNANQRE
jgi:hypothetical protein